MTGRVAVIGAGPGGLVAARWLLSQGFEPTIFEQAPTLGGQWTGLARPQRCLAGHAHQHQPHPDRLQRSRARERPRFPVQPDILDYLHRYAEMFGLDIADPIRHPGRLISRDDGGWLVATPGSTESFDRVVVASGRFQSPVIPEVPGLDTFAGSAGVISTYHYREADRYRGKRVLVAGCAVSSLEIASELAQSGAARVVVTQRRQRYVLPKFAAGVPSDHRIFTRYGVLANETPAGSGDRPPAQGDRRRGRRQP